MKDFRYLFNSISPFSKKNVYGGEANQITLKRITNIGFPIVIRIVIKIT